MNPTYVRSHKKVALSPGWKMTDRQRLAYFSMWRQVMAKLELFRLPKAEQDIARQDLHERAGLGPISAKAIDHLKGYDAIKSVFLAILDPDNLEAQLRIEYMPCTRLMNRIRRMAPEAYTRVIMKDRWGANELNELDESELTMLRNTLEARLHANEGGQTPTQQPQITQMAADVVLPDGQGKEAKQLQENPF